MCEDIMNEEIKNLVPEFDDSYDSPFIRFIGDGFFKKIDECFYKNISDCGFADLIDSQVYRYDPLSEKYSASGDAAYRSWFLENVRPDPAQDPAFFVKFERNGCLGLAFPIRRIDVLEISRKRLNPTDSKVMADPENYYHSGYIYFVLNRKPEDNYIAVFDFMSAFLRTIINLFNDLITGRHQLECKTRESADYELLMNVSSSIISSLDLNEVLQGIVNGATESLKSHRGSLMLIDDSSGDLVLRYAKGMKPELINNVRVKLGEGIAGSVAKTGEPLLITDIENADKFKKKSGKEFNNKSLLSVPLKVKNNIVGVFNINNKYSGDVYDEFDLKLLKALSNQAAMSIQNARHYQEALQLQVELEEQIEASSNLYEEVHTLYEIVRASTMVNDPKSDPRDRILELATKTLGARVGFLFLPHDANSIQAVSIKGEYNDSFQFSKVMFSEENIITRTIKSLQSVLVTDADTQNINIQPAVMTVKEFSTDDKVSEISQLVEQPVKSLLIVPLFDENSTSIGVILLVNKINVGNFTEPNRNLLQILGQQISSIIRDKNLLKEYLLKQTIEKEIDVARGIQQKLIPKTPPVLAGIDIYAVNRAAKTVSGDYYDFLNHDDEGKKIGFVIADVSGKGVPAALIMAMTRAILRTQVVDNYSPADILYKTNNFLITDMENNRYVTMFYGLLDIDTLEYTYVKAGHNPPLWMHGDTLEIDVLDAMGFFVGMFDSARYEEKKIKLATGDKLILFTDGVIEAMNEANEEYGQDRFVSVIKKYNDFDARSLVDKVLKDIELFVGAAPQSDDITLMVISVSKSEFTDIQIKSDTKSIVEMTNFFGEMIEQRAIANFERSEAMMIIDELLMNAVEHGNKKDEDKKVYISYILNDYKFEMVIRDEGEGFGIGKVMAGHEKLSLYDRRGRGLLIVKNLVDIIEYNKEGNEVRISKFFR